MSGESLLPSLQMAIFFHHVVESKERKAHSPVSFYKGTNPIDEGHTLAT